VASIESTYRWMDKVTCENEFLLLIKTLPNHYELVKKTNRDNHPYELPEIVRIPINGGSQDYLNWIKECVE
jgi:periplasmic divalent cation tolerance protein